MSDLKATIAANNVEFQKHFNAKDFDSLKLCYTEDAHVLPPGAGGKVFVGRDEIAAFWKGAADSGLGNLNLKTNLVYAAGDYVVEESPYEHSGGSGNYIVVWHKVGETYLIKQDIFN
eukprot:TRINITY_DN1988_c6_g1_i1.p1 TRINITY_DN1988_c6_g1~~TRINITY_DN1988_c6_g1_i1.p1  ORF type:complete len:124 (+),score=47.38 TRINITY_DN1988_c6_g1_i1:24-374(+)